jgi:replicative superfamily II helicase
VARGEKIVAVVAPREAAVAVAAAARDQGAVAAYLHGGLPVRLREIVTQAFREGRLNVLVTTVALDEEALPPDVRHLILGAIAPDLDWCRALCGGVLAGHRPVTITLAAGPADRDRYRRVLDAQAPERDALVAVYRAIRDRHGERPFLWPDDAVLADLAAARPTLDRAAVDAACEVFVEAGVAARETLPQGAQYQLCGEGRRDLAASLRYREGRRAREAFEAGAAWMLGVPAAELERGL